MSVTNNETFLHSTNSTRANVTLFPPKNVRNNLLSLWKFSRFAFLNVLKTKFPSWDAEFFDAVRKTVFRDLKGWFHPHGYTVFSDDDLNNVRLYQIEFLVSYHKKNGSLVTPVNIKNYIIWLQLAVQSIWRYDLKLLQNPIFASEQHVLFSVINNPARIFQRLGLHPVSHIFFSKIYLIKLYDYMKIIQDLETSTDLFFWMWVIRCSIEEISSNSNI